MTFRRRGLALATWASTKRPAQPSTRACQWPRTLCSRRLILCLLFAPTVFGEDAPGGWTKLGRGLTERFGLRDRYVRRRAVQALERGGVVEVRRRQGATTLLRLKDRQD